MLSSPLIAASAGAALALVPAATALAQSSATAHRVSPERDFTMRIDAGNAVMRAVAGASGAQEVVLRGVAPEVTVTYVARPRHQYRIPLEHALRYWTAYGDVSGQFRADPPIGALRLRSDSRSQPVTVALRGGRRIGSGSVRFRIGPATRAKARDLTTRIARRAAFRPGRAVQLHIDMPDAPRIDVPRRESATEHGWMTCNGVYSNQLLACSTPNGPPASWRIPTRTYTYCELPAGLNSGSPIFIYSVVGIVSNANSFGPGSIAAPAGEPFCGMSPATGFGGPATFGWGTWYGVSPGWVTYYTASRCNYFLAAFSAHGGCY